MGMLEDEPGGFSRRERLYDYLLLPLPAVGAEVSIPVPGGEVWHLLSITATLATSAVVSNRIPQLVILNADGATLFRTVPGGAFTAGLNGTMGWFHGAQATALNGATMLAPLLHPSIPLFPGMSLATSTGGLDAGDQWKAVRVYREIVRLRGKGAELRYEQARAQRRAELEASIAPR